MKAYLCQNFDIKIISDGHNKKHDSVTLLRNALGLLIFEKTMQTKI